MLSVRHGFVCLSPYICVLILPTLCAAVIASAFSTLFGGLCWFLFGPLALNGADFVVFVKNQMFINPSVFDKRVLQTRSSKTPAFIAIQFGGGLADNVPN